VLTHKTDPFNKDSDFDLLFDGPEVLKYKTNPLDPDTDDGGVTDGHEVIDDKTDPLEPKDDLVRYEINVEFDVDSAKIRSIDHREIDIVIKTMQRDAPRAWVGPPCPTVRRAALPGDLPCATWSSRAWSG
jgi:hypothetical protein